MADPHGRLYWAERIEDGRPAGTVTLLDPLPRRVRLRLWLGRHRDGAAIWLVDHRCLRAAAWLWRLTGGWG